MSMEVNFGPVKKHPYKVISLGLFTCKVVGPGINEEFRDDCDYDGRGAAESLANSCNIAWNKGNAGELD